MWKWIKIPKGIALLAFILPWMTVSCSGTKLVSATGYGLAIGQFTSDVPERIAASTGNATNLLLILAIATAAIGLVVALFPYNRVRALVLTATSAASLALIWAGTSRYSKSAILAEIDRRSEGRGLLRQLSSSIDQTTSSLVQVQWHVGFYITMAALVAAGVMALLSVGDRSHFR